jgi:hypothetical protein
LKNEFSCHPERSEGSQAVEKTRFFASLRMTTAQLWENFNSLIVVYNRSFIFFVNEYPGVTGKSLKEGQIQAPPAGVQARDEKIFRQ